MAEEHDGAPETTEYAGGWITERKGTDVPGFLKLAFPVIGGGSALYLILYRNGEVDHSDRGALVRSFNAVSQAADPLIWAVFALGAAFVVLVVWFALGKVKH